MESSFCFLQAATEIDSAWRTLLGSIAVSDLQNLINKRRLLVN